MHISAKSDYAVRAMLTLAANDTCRVTVEQLVESQTLPRKFLESIMGDLRRAGLVISKRGSDGGFVLARTPAEITIADVLRAVDGPLAEVRGLRPEQAVYHGSAAHLNTVWVAVRAALRTVLDTVTLADVLADELPEPVRALTADPTAWLSR